MSDIKKHLLTRLGAAGLTPKDLEKPGAHVLISDGEDLHVLVKKTKDNEAIDKLEAEVPGYRGALGVTEEPVLSLDELGEWRDFAVTGLSGEALETMTARAAELRIFAPVEGDALPPFFASVDLAFAMIEVIGRGAMAVRPVPPGERDGKKFIEVTPQRRGLIHTLTQRWVDDAIPEDQWLKVAERWRQLQADVYDTGLIGAETLGLSPDRPEAPRPDIAPEQAPKESRFGLSGDTVEWLEGKGVALPEKKANLAWVEQTIDGLRGAPESVVLDLRELLGRLHDARDQAGADMFSVDAGEAKPREKEIVFDGQNSLRRTRQNVLSQLGKVTVGLGVSEETIGKLADQLAIATEPRKKPNLILIAGPKGSAADALVDLTVAVLGEKPLRIQGGDLAEPGWAVLFGQQRGFPTEGDAWLSPGNLEKHRDTAADPTPILFENLKAAGSQEVEDQAHHQRDLLARISEWLDTGFVNVFAREGRGPARQKESSLAGVAFVARWEGSAKELRDLLNGSEQLARLADRVIDLEPMQPQHAVNDLLRRVTFDVRQHFGPKGCTLELDAGTRAGLEKAARSLGSGRALDFFLERMSRDVAEAIKGKPATKYTISWSNRLITAEKEQLEQGRLPELPVPRWFGVKAG